MFIVMRLMKWESLKVHLPLGLCVNVPNPKGLDATLGFVLVFDTRQAAEDWLDGEVSQILEVEWLAQEDK